MSKLYFKYGTMSSGKSLQLLATAYNFQENNIPFIILKSEIDTRDGVDVIHSRALGDRECISISNNTDIYGAVVSICNVDNARSVIPPKWILVDEAQFLTEKQVDDLAAIVDNLNISVICYGLRTDFKTKLFSGSARLFEIADSIEEIKASCSCNNKTIFNARVDSEGNVLTDGEQIEVGGDDRYISLCRSCYYRRIGNRRYQNNKE